MSNAVASIKNRLSRKRGASPKSVQASSPPTARVLSVGTGSSASNLSHGGSLQSTGSTSALGPSAGSTAGKTDRKRSSSWRPIILGLKGQTETNDLMRIDGLRTIYNNDTHNDDTDVSERVWQQALARFLRSLTLNDLFNCLKLLQLPENVSISTINEKNPRSKGDQPSSSSSSSSSSSLSSSSLSSSSLFPFSASISSRTISIGGLSKEERNWTLETENFVRKMKAFLKIVRVYKTHITEHSVLIQRDFKPPASDSDQTSSSPSSSSSSSSSPFSSSSSSSPSHSNTPHVSWAFCFNLHMKHHFTSLSASSLHQKHHFSVQTDKLFTYDSLLTFLRSAPSSPFSCLSSGSLETLSLIVNDTKESPSLSSTHDPSLELESSLNAEQQQQRVKVERSKSVLVPKTRSELYLDVMPDRMHPEIVRDTTRSAPWRTTLPLGMESSSKFGLKMLLGSENRKSIIHTLQTFLSLHHFKSQEYMNIALELIDFFERYRNDPFSCLLGLPPSERVLERVRIILFISFLPLFITLGPILTSLSLSSFRSCD